MCGGLGRSVALVILSLRVLIVDDNADLAENIAEVLQIDGHRTDVAVSGESALLMALKNEPDVVVTDYRLPGMSGADLVRQLRGTGVHVPALLVSAYSDEETMRAATDAGA